MAWSDPRVRSFGQFLLVDSAPNPQYKKGSAAYWSTFQSGLLTYPDDHPKPAFDTFLLPIWLPHPQHGPHVFVWTQIRPSHPAGVGALQFEPHGSSRWTNIERLRYTNSYGFLTTYVALPSAGLLRLSWNDAHGRAAQVT